MLVALASAGAFAPRSASGQTPSPLQEWQFPGGIVLYKLYAPDIPEWRRVIGVATVAEPLYQGSRPYRVEPGPVIDIRYKDLLFASVGDGLGVNIVTGTHYRAGIAIGYDLGRHVHDYFSQLEGLGDIKPAPVVKLFGSYVISKSFPLVLRADVRQYVGGADGVIGDVEAFMPLPGSNDHFFMLAGPSLTLADHLYMQREFGVSPRQALASRFAEYDAHGGDNAMGVGFSSSWLINAHWIANLDGAVTRLLGSARASPITQETAQGVLTVSAAYRW